MTVTDIAALFGAMAVLAAIPSVSVMTVSARSASFGFAHGAFATAGILLGDIIFVLIAVFGLVLIADAMGSMVSVVKYLAGAYLMWLGFGFWRSRKGGTGNKGTEGSSLLSSFLAGLLVTLADQKAILFYLAFFPAFLDLSALTWTDVIALLAVTVVAVGGVKLAYAYLANQAGTRFATKLQPGLNIAASAIMVLVGLLVIASGLRG